MNKEPSVKRVTKKFLRFLKPRKKYAYRPLSPEEAEQFERVIDAMEHSFEEMQKLFWKIKP